MHTDILGVSNRHNLKTKFWMGLEMLPQTQALAGGPGQYRRVDADASATGQDDADIHRHPVDDHRRQRRPQPKYFGRYRQRDLGGE